MFMPRACVHIRGCMFLFGFGLLMSRQKFIFRPLIGRKADILTGSLRMMILREPVQTLHLFYDLSYLQQPYVSLCPIFKLRSNFYIQPALSVCPTFSRPLIGWKYYCHWGRGGWAPRRQNIVELIHVNDNICCSRKTIKIIKVSTELCHTRT